VRKVSGLDNLDGVLHLDLQWDNMPKALEEEEEEEPEEDENDDLHKDGSIVVDRFVHKDGPFAMNEAMPLLDKAFRLAVRCKALGLDLRLKTVGCAAPPPPKKRQRRDGDEDGPQDGPDEDYFTDDDNEDLDAALALAAGNEVEAFDPDDMDAAERAEHEAEEAEILAAAMEQAEKDAAEKALYDDDAVWPIPEKPMLQLFGTLVEAPEGRSVTVILGEYSKKQMDVVEGEEFAMEPQSGIEFKLTIKLGPDNKAGLPETTITLSLDQLWVIAPPRPDKAEMMWQYWITGQVGGLVTDEDCFMVLNEGVTPEGDQEAPRPKPVIGCGQIVERFTMPFMHQMAHKVAFNSASVNGERNSQTPLKVVFETYAPAPLSAEEVKEKERREAERAATEETRLAARNARRKGMTAWQLAEDDQLEVAQKAAADKEEHERLELEEEARAVAGAKADAAAAESNRKRGQLEAEQEMNKLLGRKSDEQKAQEVKEPLTGAEDRALKKAAKEKWTAENQFKGPFKVRGEVTGVVDEMHPVTVRLRFGTTEQIDGINVILYKPHEEIVLKADGVFEFHTEVYLNSQHRLDVMAGEDREDGAVVAGFAIESRIVAVSAEGEADAGEETSTYDLQCLVTTFKKAGDHLKKKKKKKKQAQQMVATINGDEWGLDDGDTDGQEISTWENKERKVDLKFFSDNFELIGKAHKMTFCYDPVTLKLEVRRHLIEDFTENPDGSVGRSKRIEYRVEGSLQGMDKSRDFKYFVIQLNQFYSVKLTSDGPFWFTDWFYDEQVEVHTLARVDELYRLQVKSQRFDLLIRATPQATVPEPLPWKQRQYNVMGTIRNMDAVNRYWGVPIRDEAAEAAGRAGKLTYGGCVMEVSVNDATVRDTAKRRILLGDHKHRANEIALADAHKKQVDIERGPKGWGISRGGDWGNGNLTMFTKEYEKKLRYFTKPVDKAANYVEMRSELIGLDISAERRFKYRMLGWVSGLSKDGRGICKKLNVTITDIAPFVAGGIDKPTDEQSPWETPVRNMRPTSWTVQCKPLDIEFKVALVMDEELGEEAWEISGTVHALGDAVTVSFRGEDIEISEEGKSFHFEDRLDDVEVPPDGDTPGRIKTRDYKITIKMTPVTIFLESLEVDPIVVAGKVHWPTRQVGVVGGQIRDHDWEDGNVLKLELDTTDDRASVDKDKNIIRMRQPKEGAPAQRDFTFYELLEHREHNVRVSDSVGLALTFNLVPRDYPEPESAVGTLAIMGDGEAAALLADPLSQGAIAGKQDDLDKKKAEERGTDGKATLNDLDKKAEKTRVAAAAMLGGSAPGEEKKKSGKKTAAEVMAEKRKQKAVEAAEKAIEDAKQKNYVKPKANPLPISFTLNGEITGLLAQAKFTVFMMAQSDKDSKASFVIDGQCLNPPKVPEDADQPKLGAPIMPAHVELSEMSKAAEDEDADGESKTQWKVTQEMDLQEIEEVEEKQGAPPPALGKMLYRRRGYRMPSILRDKQHRPVFFAGRVQVQVSVEPEYLEDLVALRKREEADQELGSDHESDNEDDPDWISDEEDEEELDEAAANSPPKVSEVTGEEEDEDEREERLEEEKVERKAAKKAAHQGEFKQKRMEKRRDERIARRPAEPPPKKEQWRVRGQVIGMGSGGSVTISINGGKDKKQNVSVKKNGGFEVPAILDKDFDDLKIQASVVYGIYAADGDPKKQKMPKKPTEWIWHMHKKPIGEWVRMDKDGEWEMQAILEADEDYMLDINAGPLKMVLGLSTRAMKKGTGACTLTLGDSNGDGQDRDSEVVITNIKDEFEQDFCFDKLVEDPTQYSVRVRTEVPVDLQGNVFTKSKEIQPFDALLQMTEHKLCRVGGEVSELAENCMLVLLCIAKNFDQTDVIETVLNIRANGEFVFPIELTDKSVYHVKVLVHPENQTCNISSHSGMIHNGRHSLNVRCACMDNPWSVGGHISGMKEDMEMVLEMSVQTGKFLLGVDSNGKFRFPNLLGVNTAWEVRFKDHMKQMGKLRKSGVKLWVKHGSGVIEELTEEAKEKGKMPDVTKVRIQSTIKDDAVYKAAELDQRRVIGELFKNGHDIEWRNADKRTALHAAAEYGQPESTGALINQYLLEGLSPMDGVDAEDKHGWTALLLAAANGHTHIVNSLWDFGARIDVEENLDRTPFFMACYNNHVETVRWFLQKGADPNIADKIGLSPMIVACQHGFLDVVKCIYEEMKVRRKRINLRLACFIDGTPFFHACRFVRAVGASAVAVVRPVACRCLCPPPCAGACQPVPLPLPTLSMAHSRGARTVV
jgi:hypothetical protein